MAQMVVDINGICCVEIMFYDRRTRNLYEVMNTGASVLSSGCAFLKCLFRAWDFCAGVVLPLVAIEFPVFPSNSNVLVPLNVCL